MNKQNNGNTDRSGFDIRYGAQNVAKWGAISLLAASGFVFGLEGVNALEHGGSHGEVGAGLEFRDPASGHESFTSIPALDALPRDDAGDLLLLSAYAAFGCIAITRLTSE